MEPLTAIFVTFGVILLIGSWILMMITSFKADFTWGLVSVFLPPLAYLYGLLDWEKAGSAITMAFIGCALIFIA